jgi:hypothetical protein
MNAFLVNSASISLNGVPWLMLSSVTFLLADSSLWSRTTESIPPENARYTSSGSFLKNVMRGVVIDGVVKKNGI